MRRQGKVAMQEGSHIKKLKRGRGRPAATDPSGDDLRDLVISAATEVYAEQGYGGTSVQKILAVSGVSRPTFYRLFKDRHEVIEAIVARDYPIILTLNFIAAVLVLIGTFISDLLYMVVDPRIRL